MVGDQINVQLRGKGFEIADCNENISMPFVRTEELDELSVVVRTLEINRAISGTFDKNEWQFLKQWGVVHGEFKPTEQSGEIKLSETEIDLDQLIRQVQEKLFYLLFPREDSTFGQQLEVVLTELNNRRDNKILHIRLEISSKKDCVVLHQLPWEILCIKCQHFERCHVSIARYIQGVKHTRQIQPSEQAEMLIVRSRPSGKEFEFVQLASDRRSIWQSFQKLPPVYGIRLKQLEDVKDIDSRTESLLSDYLDRQSKKTGLTSFLHFECHGSFGRLCLNKPSHVVTSVSAKICPHCGGNLTHNYYGHLALEYVDSKTLNGETRVHWLNADDLADLVSRCPIDFVFLNTCNSAVARRSENTFNGVAQALIRAGIPAVLGTPFVVESEGARQFAQHFYQHLFQSGSLIDALDHARQRLVNHPNLGREWYRFALYIGHQADLPDQIFVKNSSKNLSGQDLSRQDMSYKALCEWSFENANLSNANLSHSLLRGGNFSGAILTEATLVETDLSNANLSGATLNSIDLTQTSLENTRFVDAGLSGARFSKKPDDQGEEIAATLKNVDFRGAVLSGSTFIDTKLSGINFNRSNNKVTDLTNANFSGAKLFDVNFDEAELSGAKFNAATFNTVSFRGANLVGADFLGVNFDEVQEVDFSGTDLTDIQVNETFSFGKIIYDSGTRFNTYFQKVEKVFSKQDSPGVDLAGVVYLREEDISRLNLDLSRANFRGADLRGTNLSQVNLQGADLSDTKLKGANLHGTKLNRANLSNADFYNSDDEIAPDGVNIELCGADLQGADLSEAILHGAKLNGANLLGAKFIQSQLIQANFTRANLKSAIMIEADLSGADLIMADLSGVNLKDANLQSAKLIRSDLTGAQLRGVNLNRANLYGAILGDINLENEALDLRGAILPDGTKIPDDTESVEVPVEELETNPI
jgi:uncharacterized protein YjbI with pentapeptide repeats